MTEDKKLLDSIVDIDGAKYEVTAETAKKVANKLTINVIKDGQTTPITFDGSKAETIEVGDANKIQVGMDNNQKAYATITISKNEPADGSVGDIWFKYN